MCVRTSKIKENGGEFLAVLSLVNQFNSSYKFSLEWILDRQDVLKCRSFDLKKLGSEDEYQKIMVFFTDGNLLKHS